MSQPAGHLRPDSLLSVFFDGLYVPVHLSGQPESLLAQWRSSIGWLSKHLGRPALLSDLSADNIAGVVMMLMNINIGHGRTKAVRTQLTHAWRLAHELGLCGEPEQVEVLKRDFAPSDNQQPHQGGPLCKYYKREYRPALALRASRQHVQTYDRAVAAFETFASQWTGPITVAAAHAFAETVAARGASEETVRSYREAINNVLREFAPEVAPDKQPGVPLPATKAKPGYRQNFRHKAFGVRPKLPRAPEGSLRALYQRRYLPERLADADRLSANSYRVMLECLYVHLGRDLLISELTDELLIGYLTRLHEAGAAANSYNQERARLVALWNFAYHERLVDTQPRLRKRKIHFDPPEAWDEDEIRRLLAACDLPRKPIGPWAFADVWRALILCTFWTAARRRGVLSIHCTDVDLQAATVRIRGRGMKNRQGQFYRVGQECIDAIRKIWQPQPRELLFDLPIDERRLSQQFREIKEAAGLPNDGRLFQQFHKLRRSSASLTAAAGGYQAAANLLGHSNADLTKNRYVDPRMMDAGTTQFLKPLLPETPPESIDPDAADEADDRGESAA